MNHDLLRLIAGLAMLLPLVTSRESCAQDKPATAATVQGRTIPVAQLQRELALVVKDRKLPPAEIEQLQKQVLQHAVDRQLVLHYLITLKQAASSEDVDLVLARLQKKLDHEGVKQAAFLQQLGLTLAEFKEQQRWELSWQGYVEKYLTAATMQKYFDKNRRDFDGSELHVAHILLPTANDATPADLEKRMVAAAMIRQEIVEKKATFSEAAKRYSKSPTAAAGGDIGWIQRHEPMPESFTTAAYSLQVGEISPPVATAFGVHLITCLEVKPGTRTWQDAADELRPAIIRYLFRWIADKERPTAKIEYSEHWPH